MSCAAALIPFSPMQRAAAGECYTDVLELIKTTVWQFVRKHGGDFEELLSEANTAYVKGYQAVCYGRHNTDNFELEIKRWVWFELFDAHRVRTQHRRQVKTIVKNTEFPELLHARRGSFDLVEFMDELSADARIVARLVIETPADLAHTCRLRGGTDRNLRRLIRETLAEWGWRGDRIAEAFQEVTEALA